MGSFKSQKPEIVIEHHEVEIPLPKTSFGQMTSDYGLSGNNCSKTKDSCENNEKCAIWLFQNEKKFACVNDYNQCDTFGKHIILSDNGVKKHGGWFSITCKTNNPNLVKIAKRAFKNKVPKLA